MHFFLSFNNFYLPFTNGIIFGMEKGLKKSLHVQCSFSARSVRVQCAFSARSTMRTIVKIFVVYIIYMNNIKFPETFFMVITHYILKSTFLLVGLYQFNAQ